MQKAKPDIYNAEIRAFELVATAVAACLAFCC